jgi:hypothetical protein
MWLGGHRVGNLPDLRCGRGGGNYLLSLWENLRTQPRLIVQVWTSGTQVPFVLTKGKGIFIYLFVYFLIYSPEPWFPSDDLVEGSAVLLRWLGLGGPLSLSPFILLSVQIH